MTGLGLNITFSVVFLSVLNTRFVGLATNLFAYGAVASFIGDVTFRSRGWHWMSNWDWMSNNHGRVGIGRTKMFTLSFFPNSTIHEKSAYDNDNLKEDYQILGIIDCRNLY